MEYWKKHPIENLPSMIIEPAEERHRQRQQLLEQLFPRAQPNNYINRSAASAFLIVTPMPFAAPLMCSLRHPVE
jgi:hypothetical protein